MPAGDYVCLRQLGKGSFGRVFLVRHVVENTLWVMKEIDLAASTDPNKARADALKEVSMLSRLDHPNIVQYKECFQTTQPITPPPTPATTASTATTAGAEPTAETGTVAAPVVESVAPVVPAPRSEDSLMYIIMEYADAGDLNARIRSQRKPFTEQQIISWFVQLCLAIKHLHDRKCLHRDIKAENIFLCSDNRIKLGDFGISKVLSSTFANAITRIGTPYYLSPEICMNRPYNKASDMWSLGVCLYEMCQLAHPFDATSMEGLLKKIVRVPHRPIHSFYHADLRHLCDQLMQKQATKRPTIHEVLRVPIIHKEISKWLTKKQIEKEFLMQGTDSVSAAPNTNPAADTSSESQGENNNTTCAGPGEQKENVASSAVVVSSSLSSKQDPAAAVVSPSPVISSANPGAVAPVSKEVQRSASNVVSGNSSSGSRSKASKVDDTAAWLKLAEEKMRESEEKRRQREELKRQQLLQQQQQQQQQPEEKKKQEADRQTPSTKPSVPSESNASAAVVPTVIQSPLVSKRPPSSPAVNVPVLTPSVPCELSPVPVTAVPLFSPRAVLLMKEKGGMINSVQTTAASGSLPPSPTQKTKSIQNTLASQPPSPTHRPMTSASYKAGDQLNALVFKAMPSAGSTNTAQHKKMGSAMEQEINKMNVLAAQLKQAHLNNSPGAAAQQLPISPRRPTK